MEEVPIISEPIMSPIYHPSGLDTQEMYVYPGQDVEVRCNATCSIGIENVTLHYSVESSDVWNQIIMSRSSENEWIGTLPGQSEGNLIVFYVQAFGSTRKSSRTREYVCVVSDLQALELRTKIVTVATVTTILFGCTAIFALKRRRMTEML